MAREFEHMQEYTTKITNPAKCDKINVWSSYNSDTE